MKLTDDELRKVRLAGHVARGLRWGILLLVVPFIIALIVMAIVIQSTGG